MYDEASDDSMPKSDRSGRSSAGAALAIAAASFVAGFAGIRLVKRLTAGHPEAIAAAEPETDREAAADDQTYAIAYEAFAPSPTPPEAAHESLERQLGSDEG